MRPVTMFTGQWADLPLEKLAENCATWGYDGLEIATWGQHLDVRRALTEPDYRQGITDLLARHRLGCWAIGSHLVGQAVCDVVDDRHKSILPPSIWGDGTQEGVHARAAERMKDTARLAAMLEVPIVTGFTGSPIWHMLYSFPPNDWQEVERGFQTFAERWGPIIDTFEAEGVCFALEAHPTEIAYDFVTTRRALDAIGERPGFALNVDPSHLVHQSLDPAEFVAEFGRRTAHVHIKDVKLRLNGRRSILGSHVNFDHPERGWTFVSPGHGDVDFEQLIRALNATGYEGPLSVEWEDAGMNREWGARDALEFVRRSDFTSSSAMFDRPFAS